MKLIKKTNEEKGFTLIELVVVIAILAVLALILIPSITGYVNKADAAKDEANARSIYTAAVLEESQNSEITPDALTTAVEETLALDKKVFYTITKTVATDNVPSTITVKIFKDAAAKTAGTNPTVTYPNTP